MSAASSPPPTDLVDASALLCPAFHPHFCGSFGYAHVHAVRLEGADLIYLIPPPGALQFPGAAGAAAILFPCSCPFFSPLRPGRKCHRRYCHAAESLVPPISGLADIRLLLESRSRSSEHGPADRRHQRHQLSAAFHYATGFGRGCPLQSRRPPLPPKSTSFFLTVSLQLPNGESHRALHGKRKQTTCLRYLNRKLIISKIFFSSPSDLRRRDASFGMAAWLCAPCSYCLCPFRPRPSRRSDDLHDMMNMSVSFYCLSTVYCLARLLSRSHHTVQPEFFRSSQHRTLKRKHKARSKQQRGRALQTRSGRTKQRRFFRPRGRTGHPYTVNKSL